jgi:DNA-binding transcriptional regulator YiaG
MDAADVKAARESLRVNQEMFADFLGVSARSVKAWEKGTRVPIAAVRRLLTDIRRHPEHWAARLQEEAEAAQTIFSG